MAGLLGFTLADLSGAVDSRKRQYANLVRGLLSDPGATLAQLAAVDAEAARGNRYTQMSAGSVMPEVAQQGQEAMLNAALNVGGLLGTTKATGAPWYAKPEASTKQSSAEWAEMRTPAAFGEKIADDFSLIIRQDIANKDFSARGLKEMVVDAAQQKEISPGLAIRSLVRKINADAAISGARKSQLVKELLTP